MTDPATTPELARKQDLAPEAIENLAPILGGELNPTELDLLTAAWRQYCHDRALEALSEAPAASPGAGHDIASTLALTDLPDTQDAAGDLKALLGSPAIALKRRGSSQFALNQDAVTICSGSDALVLRIRCVAPQTLPTDASPAASPAADKIIALAHARVAGFAQVDPCRGALGAVAEATRDLACAGALPLGIAHNQRSGGPLDAETRRQWEGFARGVAEACSAFSLPAIAGKFSFSDETPDRVRASSPVVTAAGLVERPEHITTCAFKADGDAILLLGDLIDTSDAMLGLGGSAYLQLAHRSGKCPPPSCDPDKERELNLALRAWIHSGVVKSAQNCNRGGLAVALAGGCLSSKVASDTRQMLGAQIDLSSFTLPNQAPLRLDALLFGETQGRILITVPALQAAKVLAQAKILGVTAQRLGTVGGATLSLAVPGQALNWDLAQLAGLGAAPAPG